MDSPKEKGIKDVLSCPVCEILPTSPVYGCQNGHVICSSCKSKVVHCAVCRSERFNVRMLVVEELLIIKIIPCPYRGDGCSMPLMTGQEYSAHIIVCPFRPIECNNKDGLSCCQSQPVPYHAYMEHLAEFHDASVVQKKSFIVSCDMNGPFFPKHFKCFNKDFILHSHRNQSSFWTWVALLDNNSSNNKHYYIKLRLRYQIRGQELKSLVSDVFTQSSVHEQSDEVLKSGRCLVLSTTTLPDTAPPCVWPQYESVDDEERVNWGYDVEIWEECAYKRSNIQNKMSSLISKFPSTGCTQSSSISSGPTVPNPNGSAGGGINPDVEHAYDEEVYDDDDSDDESEEVYVEISENNTTSLINPVINWENIVVPNHEGLLLRNMPRSVAEDGVNSDAAESASSLTKEEIPANPHNGESLMVRGRTSSHDLDEEPASKRLKLENGEQGSSSVEDETKVIEAVVEDMIKKIIRKDSADQNSEHHVSLMDISVVQERDSVSLMDISVIKEESESASGSK